MSDSSFSRNLLIETWTLYSVGVLTICLRLVARCRQYGITGLKVDDYIMINGLLWYTLLCVALNVIARGGGSNLMTADDIAALTPETTAERILGSKWVFVSEHSMLLTIWSMKVCMVMLYQKLTNGLKQHQYVQWLAVYVAISFIGSELALFLTCRPLNQYWAVPAENPQCSTYQHYEIIQACFNIPGDMAMLAIAIPILASLQLPTRQKAILLIIFGLGGFIIVSSILTKLYCLVPKLISYAYMQWYFREASVAVYVTNIPAAWPLMHQLFPSMRKWGTRKRTNNKSYSHSRSKDYGLQILSHGGSRTNNDGDFHPIQSQEHINKQDKEFSKAHDEQFVLEITREVVISVDHQSVEGDTEKNPVKETWLNGQ